MAVKKALVAVSSCLQACPPLDREATPMSTPTELPSHGTSPDQHKEFFPHLSSLLPPMPANSVSGASTAHFSSMDADTDSNLDSNGTQKKVVFRMLCSNGAAGAIIGKRGAIVRALQNQTGASIIFAPPVTESGERVVTISALEVSLKADCGGFTNASSFYRCSTLFLVQSFTLSLFSLLARCGNTQMHCLCIPSY